MIATEGPTRPRISAKRFMAVLLPEAIFPLTSIKKPVWRAIGRGTAAGNINNLGEKPWSVQAPLAVWTLSDDEAQPVIRGYPEADKAPEKMSAFPAGVASLRAAPKQSEATAEGDAPPQSGAPCLDVDKLALQPHIPPPCVLPPLAANTSEAHPLTLFEATRSPENPRLAGRPQAPALQALYDAAG
eukprot:CAMPEP_0198597458 /NCGR_PEP_ID=MMETSP1462-20131121/144446_1 /TAXON_ID=1333877 /ORGANISM="Brandtodinium nutriculum, Strain RCC3387" /LENGTH=185 /DNA_ID=CAMNT_0044329119 /DNA_START=208 /DNA_END=763 /DNA_ORIENTATION=+